jgi:AbrB family looped-hinge helix DNA binding protein
MDVAITRMSSKGQIVIPAEMRKGLIEGEKLLIIRNENHIIMKKASSADTNLQEDLEFAKRTDAAWKSYEKGEFKSMPADNFLKELKKW